MSSGSGAIAVGTITSGTGDNLLRDLPGSVTNSREITIGRAKRRIQGLAGRLNLPDYISEHALNVYKMALQYGLTRYVSLITPSPESSIFFLNFFS